MAVPTYLQELHRSLDARLRPEDVLGIIVRGRPSAIPAAWRSNFRGAGSGRRPTFDSWSSMSDDFARPVGAARQFASLSRATGWEVRGNPDDPAVVRGIVDYVGTHIGGNGQRLTREQRKAAGVELSGRKYRRQWRIMRRLHHKADTLESEQQKRELQIIGRSGLVSQITVERFAADPTAAHFIAYWTARKNRRRMFSPDGKENPMDEVANYFLAECVNQENTDWAMIAMVCPNPGILKKLDDRQYGELLGQWFGIMQKCAEILHKVWPKDVDKLRMIVRRGYDSSTWNTVAQAYNNARVNWLALLTAMGAEEMLEAACPGKVMRLMAGDLAAWHQSTSGSLADANSEVWNLLPLPWEVISGDVECTRRQVEEVCRIVGVDPRETGWTAPRPTGKLVPFSVTPELVHGVWVASPEWALLLRRAGAFSGKALKKDPQLVADAMHGLAQGVVVGDLPSKPLVP